MKDKLENCWDDHKKMSSVISEYLENKYPQVEEDHLKVAIIKRDAETNIPHKPLVDAVGCDLEICQQIRWMGYDYGVIDTHGRDRESLPKTQRQRILQRDGEMCVRCGSVEDLQIHHIVPITHGGFDFDDNLATLCEPCNLKAHGGDYSSRRLAYDSKERFWSHFVEGRI